MGPIPNRGAHTSWIWLLQGRHVHRHNGNTVCIMRHLNGLKVGIPDTSHTTFDKDFWGLVTKTAISQCVLNQIWRLEYLSATGNLPLLLSSVSSKNVTFNSTGQVTFWTSLIHVRAHSSSVGVYDIRNLWLWNRNVRSLLIPERKTETNTILRKQHYTDKRHNVLKVIYVTTYKIQRLPLYLSRTTYNYSWTSALKLRYSVSFALRWIYPPPPSHHNQLLVTTGEQVECCPTSGLDVVTEQLPLLLLATKPLRS
jgi:hypothetical protein